MYQASDTPDNEPAVPSGRLEFPAKLITGYTIVSGTPGTLTLDASVLRFSDNAGKVLLQTPIHKIQSGTINGGILNIVIDGKRFAVSLSGYKQATAGTAIGGLVGLAVTGQAEQASGHNQILAHIRSHGGTIADFGAKNSLNIAMKWFGIVMIAIVALLLAYSLLRRLGV